MPWKLSSDRPIWLQLQEQLKLQILAGKYASGERFPSVRDLASEAAVNPNTMQKALAALEQDGLLIGSRTNGRTVTTDESLLLSMRDQIAEQFFQELENSLKELGYSEDEIKIAIMKKYQ